MIGVADELRQEIVHSFEARGNDFRVHRDELHVVQHELHGTLLRHGHERAQRGQLLLEVIAFDEQHLHEASEVTGEGQSV